MKASLFYLPTIASRVEKRDRIGCAKRQREKRDRQIGQRGCIAGDHAEHGLGDGRIAGDTRVNG